MSEPWEDFKSGGSVTTSEGPWTEFKKSEGPWSDFPKRPIQSLNPTPEPSLLQQAVEGFRRGFSMGEPLRRLQQSISVEKYLPSLPKFFQSDPGMGGPIPQTRTAQMTSEAEQNIARPLLVPGLPPGTTIAALPQSSMVRPPLSVQQSDATTEEVLKTIAAPLAVGEEVLPFAAGAGPLNDLLKVYPWLAKVAALDMASKIVPNVQQRFTEAGQAGGGVGELTKAILGSAVDVAAPIGLGAVSEPRVARTGALPTEYTQGSPDLPFIAKNRPAIQLPDVQKFQETPPLIGSRPLTVEQRVLSPAEAQTTSGTSEVVASSTPALKPEPLAGQISFGGEGIPSAMQAKEMVPQPKITSREQLSGTKMFSGVPLPGDLERYQELTEDALRAIRAGTLPSKESLAEIEQIKNQYGGIPPKASTSEVQKLRPAVKIGDKVYIGEQGATHADILKANGFDPKVYTHFNEARGFVSIDKPGEFLNRQQAQQISGIPGTAKAGGLDSQDLPGALRASVEDELKPWGAIGKLIARSDNLNEVYDKGGGFKSNVDLIQAAQEKVGKKELVEATRRFLSEANPNGEFQDSHLINTFATLVLRDDKYAKAITKRYLKGPNALRELRTDSISQTQPSGNIPKVEEEVRGGADAKGQAQEKGQEEIGGTSLYSGIPFRFTESKAEGGEKSPNIFWMEARGSLIPEDQNYKVAREVVHGEKEPSPGQVSDEGARTLEQYMRQKGFAKVVKYGDSIFVDQNASSTQLAGLQNLAKSEGKKLYTNVNLYSGLPVPDLKKFTSDVSDYIKRFKSGHSTKETATQLFDAAETRARLDARQLRRQVEKDSPSVKEDALNALEQETFDKLLNQYKKEWVNQLGANFTAPDGRPFFTKLKNAPEGYVEVPVAGVRVAVHPDFARLVRNLTSPSQVADSVLGSGALKVEGALKHGLLAFDTFHMFRVAFRQATLMRDVSYKKGLSLLEYNDSTLSKMLKDGDIDKSVVDWIQSKRSTAELLIRNGLNVGRIAEATYSDFVRNFPGLKQTIGTYNKWLFEKMSRGAMLESALYEFDRIKSANPKMSDVEVARKVARQINVNFGNIQRQSLIKNPSLRDLAQITFLAPQWAESILRRETIGAGQLAKGATTGKVGTLGKSLGVGVVAAVLGNQIVNMTTRGKPTWENEEPNRKLDAYIPDITGKSDGFWISPLPETPQQALQYTRQGKTPLQTATRMAANKLSPIGRAIETGTSGEDFGGRKLTDPERLKEVGKSLVPLPIPLSKVADKAPGSEQRQIASAFGVKLEPAGRKEKYDTMTLDERLQKVQSDKKLHPQTYESRERGAGIAGPESIRRGKEIFNDLPKADRNWLESRGLLLSGYPTTIRYKGVNLPMSDIEATRMAEIVKEQYVKGISILRKRYDDLPEEGQVHFYKDVMEGVRAEARQRMMQEVEKSSSIVESNRRRYKTPGLGQ